MGLLDNMRSEPVERLSLRSPVEVDPTTSVREVIQEMRASRLGCAILVDADRKPVGMFTERMLTKKMAAGTAFLDEPVSSHAVDDWPCVKLSDPIEDVLKSLVSKNVRFICVVDAEGRTAGLTGQKGLMEYIADHFPEQVMVQRVGNTPYLQQREGA